MFVRRTQTRHTDGQTYYTHRLVRSERTGAKVRQRTLVNLGGHFEIPQPQWPALCQRIDEILDGQTPLLDDTPMAIEQEAQRIAAQLLARTPAPVGEAPDEAPPARDLRSVDIDSLEPARPRSVGVEQVALWALAQLGLAGPSGRVGSERTVARGGGGLHRRAPGASGLGAGDPCLAARA